MPSRPRRGSRGGDACRGLLLALGLAVGASEPGSASSAQHPWRPEWTLWLHRAIGGYAVRENDGSLTPWHQIELRDGADVAFAQTYCPRYNGMAREHKRAFLIEVLKAVSLGESGWDPLSVNPDNPAAQGIFQMSASDMGSCQRISRGEVKPEPTAPVHAIPCAVFKLMPVFYASRTFAAQTYVTRERRTQTNHFHVLHPVWATPTRVHPKVHWHLSEAAARGALRACFQ